MRLTLVIALVLTAVMAPAAAAQELGRPPDATADANGVSTRAGFGSGCAHGPRSGICADTVWPPPGLGRPLPVAPGSTVRITFTGAVQLHDGVAESPTVWRVPIRQLPTDGVLAVSALWQDGEWHGDQVYAIPVGPVATLLGVHGSAATIDARTAGVVRLTFVRAGHKVRTRRFAVTPGRHRCRLRAARGARLRVSFRPADGRAIQL